MGKDDKSLQQVNINVMRNGNQLTTEQRQTLIQPIQEKEIFYALQDIGDTKALGLDGYNAKFFTSCWDIVKQDVIGAVCCWFKYNTVFKGFNITLVTLLSKTVEAKFLKDYRPIVCCPIVYKLYSKVLTA